MTSSCGLRDDHPPEAEGRGGDDNLVSNVRPVPPVRCDRDHPVPARALIQLVFGEQPYGGDRPTCALRNRSISTLSKSAFGKCSATSKHGRGGSKRSTSSSCSRPLLCPKAAACASSNRSCQRAHGTSPSVMRPPTSSGARSPAASPV